MQIKLPDFNLAKLLVVGDVMLDRYWYGAASRISPEAPVPIVRVQQNEERPGGAGNVALNVTALGASVSLLGLCGQDEDGRTLQQKLHAAGVNSHLLMLDNLATTTKLRVLSQRQQLIRLDFEEPITQVDNDALMQGFIQHLPNTNMVILSDYGKGALRCHCASEFIELARKAKVPVLVDPKGLDFSIYHGATVLTPNRKEFEAIVGSCRDDHEIAEKGFNLMRELELSALVVTRGEQGMTLIRAHEPAMHFPAQTREVCDVTGAGDTVIAVLATSLAAQLAADSSLQIADALPMATVLANLAAGIVVAKLGAANVTPPELRRAGMQEQVTGKGIMTEEQLLLAIEDARHHGERVVMTNGCFDILHAGHVNFLQEAKTLGDRLIVAVNDDASIARLKGPGRPINSLARRMAVLAALSAVDWVVAFSDDTPTRLIRELQPDLLVKGGEYTLEQIVDADVVKAYGGEVKIVGVKEHSTTAIVEQIKEQAVAN